MTRVFDTPLLTTDQSWERVLAAGLPVALLMTNDTTPAQLERPLRELASKYAGELLVVKAPIDDNPDIRGRYTVRRPPTLITIREGNLQAKQESVTPTLLREHVAHLLGKGPEPELPDAGVEGAPDGSPVELTDANFDQMVVGADLPVLVDFWAPWCGPCRMVEPIVERLAQESAGDLRVGKVNVDENPRTAARFGITGIPSMIVFEGGEVVDQWTGALPEPQLRSRLSRWL